MAPHLAKPMMAAAGAAAAAGWMWLPFACPARTLFEIGLATASNTTINPLASEMACAQAFGGLATLPQQRRTSYRPARSTAVRCLAQVAPGELPSRRGFLALALGEPWGPFSLSLAI